MAKDKKPYFHNVKEGDEIFGLVFGKGVVRTVWEPEGYYKFEVEFSNDHVVPYTIDGVPGWYAKLDFQTIYYVNDIDLMSMDFAPTDKVLSAKKIIKLRGLGKLMARCPSGIWHNVKECPQYLIEEYLENDKLHLFKHA